MNENPQPLAAEGGALKESNNTKFLPCFPAPVNIHSTPINTASHRGLKPIRLVVGTVLAQIEARVKREAV